MDLKLRLYPDECLRKKCTDVENIDKHTKKLAKQMIRIMKLHNGAGLSAPQVGSSERVIVWQNPESNEIFTMINPKIIDFSEDIDLKREGCLSIPGKFFDNIPRHRNIKVSYYSVKGKFHIKKYDGLSARIIQHEIDHLDGKLIIDYFG